MWTEKRNTTNDFQLHEPTEIYKHKTTNELQKHTHKRFLTSSQRLIKMYKLAVIVVLALVAATQAVNVK